MQALVQLQLQEAMVRADANFQVKIAEKVSVGRETAKGQKGVIKSALKV